MGVATVDQSWANGEFDGMIPKEWFLKNWRRFVYSPRVLAKCEVSAASERRFQGIYFLWDDERLLYVGLAKNVASRISQHVSAGKIPFRYVATFEAPGKHFGTFFLAAVECAYITALRPPYNKHPGVAGVPGGLRMSKAIRRLWHSAMSEAQAA
jgi:hypothetical protein